MKDKLILDALYQLISVHVEHPSWLSQERVEEMKAIQVALRKAFVCTELSFIRISELRDVLEEAQKWMIVPGAAGHWANDGTQRAFELAFQRVQDAVATLKQLC